MRCAHCGRPASTLIPSENWPPYRWLWERIGGRPWTHIMRDRPRTYAGFALPFLALLVLWNRRRWLPLLIGFAAGFLTGHVWW